MKILSFKVEMDDKTIKEFKPIDSILLSICESDDPEDENKPILSQISDNAYLQMIALRSIMGYEKIEPVENDTNMQEETVVEEEKSPIEVIDVE